MTIDSACPDCGLSGTVVRKGWTRSLVATDHEGEAVAVLVGSHDALALLWIHEKQR